MDRNTSPPAQTEPVHPNNPPPNAEHDLPPQNQLPPPPGGLPAPNGLPGLGGIPLQLLALLQGQAGPALPPDQIPQLMQLQMQLLQQQLAAFQGPVDANNPLALALAMLQGAAQNQDEGDADSEVVDAVIPDSSTGLTARVVEAVRLIEDKDPDLTDIDVFAENIGPSGAEAIAAALKGNPYVQLLFVGLNAIGDRGAIAIAEVMETHPTLSTVFLRDNEIGSAGLRAICKAISLPECKTAELFLGFNNFTHADVILLANAVRSNTALRLLDFDGNDIEDDGAAVLCRAIGDSKSLVEVHLSNNRLTERGGQYVLEMIQPGRNSTLKRLTLEGQSHSENCISPALLRRIRARLCANANRPNKHAFLLASHARLGQNSAALRSFFNNELFERSLLKTIAAFHDDTMVRRSKYDQTTDTVLAGPRPRTLRRHRDYRSSSSEGSDDSGPDDDDETDEVKRGPILPLPDRPLGDRPPLVPLPVPDSLSSASTATSTRGASSSASSDASLPSPPPPLPPAPTAGSLRSPPLPLPPAAAAGSSAMAVDPSEEPHLNGVAAPADSESDSTVRSHDLKRRKVNGSGPYAHS